MAKRNNRADFDDFEDNSPFGYSSYQPSPSRTEPERPELDNWAEDTPREKNHTPRRRRRFRFQPWMAVVAAVLLLAAGSLLIVLPETGQDPYRPENSGPENTLSLYEPIVTQPQDTDDPPVTLPQFPPVTEPAVPPATQPSVTEPALPPATQSQVTQPPATEPPQTEPPATES